MLPTHSHLRWTTATVAACAALVLAAAIPAVSPAATYPAGGGVFAVDAEGWQETEATCSIELAGLCSASGGHAPGAGAPAGSLAAEATVTLNLGGLFESTVVLESPDFTVGESGEAQAHLDRQFEPGGLLSLAPEATYTVSLIDRGTEVPAQVLVETLGEGDSSFAGVEAAAPVVAGRTYALAIRTEIGSATASLGLLGSAIARFDNVSLSTEDPPPGEGGGGGGGGDGSGGAGDGGAALTESGALTASELLTSVRRGDAASAGLRGKHVFARVRCPKRAGRACRITVQGRIRKRIAVTRRSTARVKPGKVRLVALRVKPRFRETVERRKRLLIVQKVRVGNVTATYARSRALIRRP